MKIHETIRLLRAHRGYSQEYVAEQLNIDAVNFGRIERGITKLTVERLEQIASILGFSLIKMLELSSELPENKNNTEFLDLLKRNIELSEQILKELKRS